MEVRIGCGKITSDPDRFRKIVKESKSIAEIIRTYGYNVTGSIYNYIKSKIIKYNIPTNHFVGQRWSKGLTRENSIIIDQKAYKREMPLNSVFKQESNMISRSKILKKLLKYKIKEKKCEKCNRTDWLGGHLSLEVHHVNGINTDNRIDNLKVLCSNCHTQEHYINSVAFKNIREKMKKANKKEVQLIIDEKLLIAENIEIESKKKQISEIVENKKKQVNELVGINKNLRKEYRKLISEKLKIDKKLETNNIKIKEEHKKTLPNKQKISSKFLMPKDKLEELYKERSLIEISKESHISYGVIKRLKKEYNIQTKIKPRDRVNQRKFNTPKEELQKLVYSMPTSKLSKLLGVSDVAVAKRCKRLGIGKPPRGYWAKVEVGKL